MPYLTGTASVHRVLIIACLMLVMAGLSATAHAADDKNFLSSLKEEFNLSGYLKNETAFRYQEPRAFTKIRNIAYLRGRYVINNMAEISGSAWAYYDLAYDLFDYDTISARAERDAIQPLNFIENLSSRKDSGVIDLRELYLDVFLDNVDLRIGQQFIIWGVMTGIRIVDELNPMDFRELILPDLLDYRVPLFSTRANVYVGNDEIQLVWIPDIQFHKPAPQGSEWELLQEVPGTVYRDSFTLKNSEYGIRWSGTRFDTELSLSYFNTWDDFPVIFRKVPIEPVAVDGVVAEPEFYPRYTRIQMYGATLQRQIGGQILKGEFAFVKNKYFGLTTIDRDNDGFLDNMGELKRDHIRWGLGVDFNVWKTDISPGLTQWIILDYDPAIIQGEYDTAFNLFVRKEMPQYKATFQMLLLRMITMRELYVKPKVTFNVTDLFSVAAGLDLFYGQSSQVGVGAKDGKAVDILEIEQRFQFLGNFSNNKRLFLEFKYSF